jgi:chromosome segregation ATPase
MRAVVREELRSSIQDATRKELKAQLDLLEDKLTIADRVLTARKKMRDDLDKQLSARAVKGVNLESQLEALKPKKEVLAKLQIQLAELEIGGARPPKTSTSSGVEAKLDVLLREVEELRKDVRELKKR